MVDAVRRYKARRARRLRVRMDEEDWVTIKGTHVLIDEEGNVTGGPSNLRSRQFKNAKPSARAKRQATAPKQKKIADCKDYDEFEEHVSKKYGCSFDSGVRNLDFEAVKDGISSFDEFESDFNDALKQIGRVVYIPGTVAATNGSVLCLGKLFKNKAEFTRACEHSAETGWWAKNSSIKSAIAHEIGHVIESYILRNSPETKDLPFWEISKAWDNNKIAKGIVAQACRNVKKTDYGKGKKSEELIEGISRQSAERGRGEAFAEAFADYVANGENANPLSLEIVKISKEKYKACGGK